MLPLGKKRSVVVLSPYVDIKEEVCFSLLFFYNLRSASLPLRVQVPNNHILTQSLYYNPYYPKPKYLIIGYLDPLGSILCQLSLLDLQDLWPWRFNLGSQVFSGHASVCRV